MSKDYSEPLISVCVLDYCKPQETRLLLESLRDRIKFPHKVIYLHNGGGESYGYEFFKMGLIDQFIQTRENNGLGIGTRDLMAASFSRFTMYVQNDQVLGRDFTKEELDDIIKTLTSDVKIDGKTVMSISLAGYPCGKGIYSERAHIITTDIYKGFEFDYLLKAGGAGPYHHQPWREGTMQDIYKLNNYIHYAWPRQLFIDNGKYTIRDQPCGGKLRMRTDTKSVVWLVAPKEKYVFPDMTDKEWEDSIAGKWVNGTIPENYLKGGHSFQCWGNIEP